MRLAKAVLVLGSAALVSAGCGGGGGGSGALGLVDLRALDPSVETYTGDSSPTLFENGLVGRINASAAPVHDGLVSVWFQDVEFQEIRFPEHSHPTRIRVAQGGSYVFHVWCQQIDVGGGANVTDVQVDLLAVFYIGSVFVSSTPPATLHLTSFGAWEMLSFPFEVPFGADSCYVSMKATAAAGLNVDLFLDDFSLERTD